MGNHRFRLSAMMPNAWFYKLKDMGHRASKNHSTSHSTGRGQASKAAATTASKPLPPPQAKLLPNRASCYYSSRAEAERFSFSPTHNKALDTHFRMEPPRKSSKKPFRAPTKPRLVSSSVSAGCRCRAWKSESILSPETPPPYQRDYYIDGDEHEFQKIDSDDRRFEYDDFALWSHPCSCRVTSSATDIIIDMDNNKRFDEFDSVSELKLRPIITKPATKEAEPAALADKIVDEKVGIGHRVSLVEEQNKNQAKRSSPGFHRIRMRANSPRLASKKVQTHRGRRCTGSTAMQQRKGLSGSFAVVKSSSDPQRDFRDSMLEMIVENNIRTSKDLEELLACYLSLNSNEYHDVIVKVFQQIWFDLTNIKL